MELIKSKVVFNEAEHKYTLEGRELSGITRILSKHLFPDKYKNIPEATLNTAAERGSHIHKEIQKWIEKGESGYGRIASLYIRIQRQIRPNVERVFGKQ